MTQPEKPPYITEHTWAGLSPTERAGIAAGWQASRRQEVAVSAQPGCTFAPLPPPDTPLNVLEEMQVERFLSDVGWSVAVRDDARVAQAVVRGEVIDAVYTLEDAAALDEFFQFLKTQGFVEYFEELAERMRVQRINVPPVRYIWLYFTKLVLGIEGMAAMSPLMLRDEAIMRLVGFNAHEIRHGTTQRGNDKREPGSEREGPVSTEAVADNIVKFHWMALAAFFNQVVVCCLRLLAPDEKVVDVVVDTSLYETGPDCDGAGKTHREKPVKGKSKQARRTKVDVVIHGFKVGVAYHARLGLPLAVTIATIQTSDHTYVEPLVRDTLKNLGPGKAVTFTFDAGFIDGAAMHTLKQVWGVDFVVRARSDMQVYKDAVALAQTAGKPRAEEVWKDTRSTVIRHGQGRAAHQETVRTEVVGVEALKTWDTYAPAERLNEQNRKSYEPDAVNAVVVNEWGGHRFKDPLVVLTSHAVRKPFTTFDRYDDRSLIENGAFRESKQDWSWERPPKNTEDGVNAHVYLALAVMALVRTYRILAPQPVASSGPLTGSKTTTEPVTPLSPAPAAQVRLQTGMLRYRRELLVQNRNKVILFLGDAYGILHVQEMAMLSGVKIRDRSPGVGTREQTLQKYGLGPDPGGT